MELRKLTLNGHSQAVTLPPRFLKALNIKSGEYVEMFIGDNNTIVIRRHNTYGRNQTEQ